MQYVKAITVRSVPSGLARALEREKKRRGQSLNQTVLELLALALGISQDETRSNGLGKLAGDWSNRELAEFEAATAVFGQVDEELWR